MSELEDRIFHLEVLCGLREPCRAIDPPVTDGYSAATVYFNNFMRSLSTVPPCDVCGKYHRSMDD
jgi:hypothetical protein